MCVQWHDLIPIMERLMRAIPINSLNAEDLARYPVWEYDRSHESRNGRDETWVVPVEPLPVRNLSGRLVAASLELVNGCKIQGMLGNVSLSDSRAATSA